MSAQDFIADVGEWTKNHKPVAIGVAGGTVLLIALFAIRKRNAVNGMGGATAAGIGSASLVPYGDATSMGFTGLTGLHDATTGGFAMLSEQLGQVTGLLTTLQPVGSATSGGTETGNTVPTTDASGGSVGGIGGLTGSVSVPAAVPSVGPDPVLIPVQQPLEQPTTSPVVYAPEPVIHTPYTPPQVYTPPPVHTYTPTPILTAVPAQITKAIEQVGGGIPQPQRTNVGGIRAYKSFNAESQRILRSGGTVVAGDGRVFKNIIGSDGTPHATSIGMVGEVI